MVGSMDIDKVGKYITKLRKINNLTQEQLAEKIGVSNKTISKWETGINIPDTYFLFALSKEFDVTIQDILNGEKIINPSDSNNIIIKFINFYNSVFKKRIIRFSFMIIVIITILFSVLYTVNNYNQNKVFEIQTDNGNSINGFLISNPKESIIFINKIDLEDINLKEGEEFEPLVSSYSLYIKDEKNSAILYGEENSFRQNYYLSQFVKNLSISFVIDNEEVNDLKLKDFDNIYLQLIYCDSNNVEYEVKFKLKIVKHYSNTKAIY